MEAEGAAEADFAHDVSGFSEGDEVGLDVAFDPAGALADPEAGMGAGFFPGGAVEHAGFVAFAREADAEVAVFGNVEGVPAHELPEFVEAEVIGGAAEGDGCAEVGQAGEEEVEPHAVFEGEEAGEKVLAFVVEVEPRLKADDFRR